MIQSTVTPFFIDSSLGKVVKQIFIAQLLLYNVHRPPRTEIICKKPKCHKLYPIVDTQSYTYNSIFFTSKPFQRNKFNIVNSINLLIFIQNLFLIIDNCSYSIKLALNFKSGLVPIQNKKIGAEIAPSNGAFWDKFSEQRQHQCIRKHQFQSSISNFSCK